MYTRYICSNPRIQADEVVNKAVKLIFLIIHL